MITRLVIILLVFFGILYYFQGPLKQAPAAFDQLHSPYVSDFKNIFNQIITASSSSIIGDYKKYTSGFPGTFNAVPSSPSSSLPSWTNQNSQRGTTTVFVNGESSNNSGVLLPVVSNEGEGTLSATGVISDTNNERARVGLPNLSRSDKLTESAEAKLQDMFQNQYFAHVSPSGENVSNVVTRAGYDYIVVGENLALGLFPSDEAVVAAWMASPGHKKNILDPRYQNIGVAVGQGIYQGRKQWLIVQHFGKPLDACPSPSQTLKQTITAESTELSALEQRITTAKTEVDQSAGTSDYWSKVDTYNLLVTEYNSDRVSLEANLSKYNASVKTFNDCIGDAS